VGSAEEEGAVVAREEDEGPVFGEERMRRHRQ
jgi:hypothetical protein